MGKILDAFADGRLCVEDEIERRSLGHTELSERVFRLQEELEERLGEEEKGMLGELMDAVFEEGLCYAQNRFVRGYRLGVLMAMEIFGEQDACVMD